MRVISRLDGFNENGKLSTWILGIAVNVCRELTRKESRWASSQNSLFTELAAKPEATTTTLENFEERNLLTEAVSKLPQRQKEAIILRYFEALSIKETAAVMGVATGTAKATIHTAINNLKSVLEGHARG